MGTAEAAGLVGEALDASRMDSLVAEGELKAPSLGRRILRVGVGSGFGPGGAGRTVPFVAGGLAGLDARVEALFFFLELAAGGARVG